MTKFLHKTLQIIRSLPVKAFFFGCGAVINAVKCKNRKRKIHRLNKRDGVVPRQDALLKLAKFFKVSTDELLGNFNFKETNMKLNSIQRNLKKLNDSDLDKADAAMKLLFGKIWEEDEKEEHGDL